MWEQRSFVKLTSLTRIIEKLAKNASKSPGPVESKPRERIESFSMSFNAICSEKAHKHETFISSFNAFNSVLSTIQSNRTKQQICNGCLLWRGDRDPQIRRNLPSRSERENPAHRNQTRYNRDACMNREKKIAKNERIRSWPERRSVRGWRIRRTEGKCEEREGFFDCWSSEPLWGRRKRWRENWRKKLIFSGKWKGEFEWKGEGKRIEIFRVRGIWFSDLKYVMRTG